MARLVSRSRASLCDFRYNRSASHSTIRQAFQVAFRDRSTSSMSVAELTEPYPLDESAIRQFREDGFIRLPGVLRQETLAHYTPELDRLVDEGNQLKNVPLEQRTLYDQAFVQVC